MTADAPPVRRITAFAPGRVNLIGDHTDYSGGLVCPMAIDLGTTVSFEVGGDVVDLTSATQPGRAVVPLDTTDPALITPTWARYVAGVIAVLQPGAGAGGVGEVTTTLPVGGGLSSSAALEVATALALGARPAVDAASAQRLASLCQHAEHLATGVPSGIMDQLASVAGVEGHALLIDCATLTLDLIPVPADLEVVVVHSGEVRTLAESGYADREASVSAATAFLGRPLAHATPADVEAIGNPVVRRRARHVVTENARVRAFGGALSRGASDEAGALMNASHASLRDDFEVSTPGLDALVARLQDTTGVWGARLTGAGFGGCAVALTRPGALRVTDFAQAWVVRPSAGARVVSGAPTHGPGGRTR